MYAVKVQLSETVSHLRLSRLGAVALVPVGLAYPVAQLGAFVIPVYDEADGPDELVAVTQRDRQMYLAVLQLVVEGVDPILRRVQLVRMRNHPDVGGDVPVSGKPLHLRGIAQRKWPEYEAFRFDLNVFGHECCLPDLIEWRFAGCIIAQSIRRTSRGIRRNAVLVAARKLW